MWSGMGIEIGEEKMRARIEEIEEWELRNLYEEGNNTIQKIADYYRVSWSTICMRMKEYNIQIRAPRLDGIEEWELHHLYKEGMSQLDLAAYFGVSQYVIWSRMKEYGIKAREKSESRRIYSINEDFFKTWTPESAWLYGWLLGDGSLSRDRLFRFSLGRIDKEVLFKFKYVLDSNHPVVDTNYECHNVVSYMSKVDIYSAELVKDIKHLHYESVPISLFNHFVRGFFEA